MKPEEIRAAMGGITEKLKAIKAAAAGKEYTPEQLAEIEKLNSEFEALDVQLVAAERMEAIEARASATPGRQTQAGSPAPRVEVGKDLSDRCAGFKSAGDWLNAVKMAAFGEVDKRLIQNAAAYERTGEDGGFLVPDEITSNITKKLENPDESLMARANVTTVSGNTMSMPIDEKQPWNGGITAAWTAEGATIGESKPSFGEANWKLHKLAALVKVTDELLDDATALASYINNNAPNAINYQVNKAILSGNGVGKPSGLIGSGFAVTVSKEDMQAADTVNARNLVKMFSHMLPGSRGKAVWLINPGVEPQLRLATDDNDEFIYMSPGGIGGQLSASPFGSLLGRPVMPLMGGIPALGDLGDIIFVDLSMSYWMIRKAGVKSAQSIHLLFDKEQTAFRFSLRLDGKCPFKTPVRTEYGSYDMSGIVLLEAR